MAKADDDPQEATDFRKDSSSTAHSHVRQEVDGISIVDSHPPNSVAQYQRDSAGYDPAKFFDPNNAEKHVQGVSMESGNVVTAQAELIEATAEQVAAESDQGDDNALDHDMADDD